MNAGDKAVKLRNVFLAKMGTLASKRSVNSWSVPPGNVPIQNSPAHMIHFVRNLYKNATLLKNKAFTSLFSKGITSDGAATAALL